MYKFQVMTNDFQFLFQFAYETEAVIEVLESEDVYTSFLLCYDTEGQRDTAHDMLMSYLVPSGGCYGS
ncbi:hypothetical protein [Ruminococcus gauvreauii]|uniref:hypothetical protein n=1 Tax=Ruminococcus gauvreauii TaxID=438033 RepID=UPI0039844E62